MLSDGGALMVCNHHGCGAAVKTHKWGQIKDGADWFFSRNGIDAWCPEHLPDWVEEWRKRNG